MLLIINAIVRGEIQVAHPADRQWSWSFKVGRRRHPDSALRVFIWRRTDLFDEGNELISKASRVNKKQQSDFFVQIFLSTSNRSRSECRRAIPLGSRVTSLANILFEPRTSLGFKVSIRSSFLSIRIRFFLLDDQPVKVDAIRVITATQLINMTVSHLHIATSRISDSGSYRCSDGNHAQSREARLYLQDLNEQILFRSLSSSSMSNSVVFLFSFSVSLFSLAMFGEIYWDKKEEDDDIRRSKNKRASTDILSSLALLLSLLHSSLLHSDVRLCLSQHAQCLSFSRA